MKHVNKIRRRFLKTVYKPLYFIHVALETLVQKTVCDHCKKEITNKALCFYYSLDPEAGWVYIHPKCNVNQELEVLIELKKYEEHLNEHHRK